MDYKKMEENAIKEIKAFVEDLELKETIMSEFTIDMPSNNKKYIFFVPSIEAEVTIEIKNLKFYRG